MKRKLTLTTLGDSSNAQPTKNWDVLIPFELSTASASGTTVNVLLFLASFNDYAEE